MLSFKTCNAPISSHLRAKEHSSKEVKETEFSPVSARY